MIFDPLTAGFVGFAVLAHALVGRRGTRAARAFGRAVAQQVGSFVGSCAVKIYSKRADYQSGRPDLNRRPLDPQSRSGRRWTWLSVAQWALDQPRQSPGVAGCRLRSACVDSWNGSFERMPAARTGAGESGRSRRPVKAWCVLTPLRPVPASQRPSLAVAAPLLRVGHIIRRTRSTSGTTVAAIPSATPKLWMERHLRLLSP